MPQYWQKLHRKSLFCLSGQASKQSECADFMSQSFSA